MGRSIFIIAVGIMLGASYLMLSAQRSALETQDEQSLYEHKVLARDIAESGLDRAVSDVRRELMNTQQVFSNVAMNSGRFDARFTPNLYGDLDLAVTGQSGPMRHQIDANLIFETPVDAAVALSARDLRVVGSGAGYAISGTDVRTPTRAIGTGFLRPTFGVITDDAHVAEATVSLQEDNVVGAADPNSEQVVSGSIRSGFDQALYEALYQEARGQAGTVIDSLFTPEAKATMLQQAIAGSGPDQPRIIRVLGDLYLNEDLQGYGMLIVEDGSLFISTEQFTWEGLVLVRKPDTLDVTVSLADGAMVHGGLAAYEFNTNAECTPVYDIPDGNGTTPGEPVRVRLDVLGAAISFGGEYNMPVTAQVVIGDEVYEPWGDYDDPIGANVNGTSGLVFELPDVVPAGTSITVNARSWERQGDAPQPNGQWRWQIWMEKDTDDTDDQLVVLPDSTQIPTVAGYLDQPPVTDFLQDYTETYDEPGGSVVRTKLDDNQTIYLFELGVDDPDSPAHDMQDLVVVLTMTVADPTVRCPAPELAPLTFSISGEAQVHYSGEALAKLGKLLDLVVANTRVVIARQQATTLE